MHDPQMHKVFFPTCFAAVVPCGSYVLRHSLQSSEKKLINMEICIDLERKKTVGVQHLQFAFSVDT